MSEQSRTATTSGVEKVAILGGGPSALSAAFELSDPAQRGRYDVTVYQLGWRLGGKCASGRNAKHGNRVQEHGLHIFLGSYDNAFDLLRRCYDELDRPPGHPFAGWNDALQGIDRVGLMENVDGEWKPWVVKLPRMPGSPGEAHHESFFSLLKRLLSWLGEELHHHAARLHQAGAEEEGFEKPDWWDRLVHKVFPAVEGAAVHAGARVLGAATAMVAALAERVEGHSPEHHERLAALLDRLRKWFHKLLPEKLEDDLRHFVMVFDLILVNAVGALRDGLVLDPEAALPRVNRLEYRAWLRRHHALEITVDSPIVHGLYDLIFAYPDGDVTQPGSVEAGTMFISLTQTSRYHGSFMWKMMAGTADVVAGPLYEVMRRRGVRFSFFHRVTDLVPSADGNWIQQVRISRQVRLENDEYRPLVDIKGLPSWPSEPLYDQIEEGERLREENIDLESRWTPWKDTGGELVLEFGRDFDWLVLGTSLAPLAEICGKLADRDPRWRAMIDGIGTVQTQSVQLWFRPELEAINSEIPRGVALGAYDKGSEPIDTWADISEILGAETWPENTVGNASIICGPMKGPPVPPPSSDKEFPARSAEQVRANLDTFIRSNGRALWPGLYGDSGFREGDLVSRYLRVNIDPSERYVLTCPDTTKFRMRAQDSGFRNLYLTGDWTQNGQNLGSFEASITSGKLASRALSGMPRKIFRIPEDSPLYGGDPGSPPAVSGPRFVEHPFMQTFPGPASLADTTMWSFWLPGDMEKLTALCHRTFGEPSGGEVEYLPLTSQVLVSVVDIARGSFTDVPEMGWSSERELAFWILMARVRRKDGVPLAEKLGLFNPLLVLDNPVAVATGRETYGYLKQQGWIDTPGPDAPGAPITVDAFATTRFGSDSEQYRQRFLALEPLPGECDPATRAFSDLAQVAASAREALAAEMRFMVPTPKLLHQLFDDLVHHEMPQVFLKQFRSVEDTRRACYQAIIETPIQVKNLRGVHLEHPHRVEIAALDSIDVNRVLGIPRQHQVDSIVRLQMDMVLDTGRELWRAP